MDDVINDDNNMKKDKLRKLLMKIHFSALALAILNYFIKEISYYSFEGNIEFGIIILTLISGLVLFFFYSKKINLYFSIYALISIFFVAGILLRGFLGIVILSILLYPVDMDDKHYEKNGLIISTPFDGFLGSCCKYELKERKFLVFEKKYGTFETNGSINFETLKIIHGEREVQLNYTTDTEKDLIKAKKIQRNGS